MIGDIAGGVSMVIYQVCMKRREVLAIRVVATTICSSIIGTPGEKQ